MEIQNIEHPKASPKDVFLHLGSIVALYGSAIAFLILTFNLFDMWMPDVAEYYSARGSASLIRGAIAALIVFFPMYIVSLKMLHKAYTEDETRKKVWIRKWLLYFTLFVTTFVIAGDLISLIYNFLNGEFTVRFILKVLVVFFVAVSIFWYYRRELKDLIDKTTFYVGIGISSIILISIVIGFMFAGSPMKERTRKLDEQRISHLSTLQMNIVEYWQNKGKLPENLSVLRDDLRNISIPQDPETRTEYGYGIKGEDTFILCAVFGGDKEKENGVSYDDYYFGIRGDHSWNYKAGKSCFERTIDADFFNQKNGVKALPQ
ncbi:MAG: hypothetical protein LiPW41_393 [Parcubacteria group bacterium LiPW_41]|nr:MAG: hypothetical protein LiPW41_393 [Parcubacteria group bacterium LiPW_41]